jgi:hypothetical protein
MFSGHKWVVLTKIRSYFCVIVIISLRLQGDSLTPIIAFLDENVVGLPVNCDASLGS